MFVDELTHQLTHGQAICEETVEDQIALKEDDLKDQHRNPFQSCRCTPAGSKLARFYNKRKFSALKKTF
jgi:hypothetical protein